MTHYWFDLVFVMSSGEWVTHVAHELDRFAEVIEKKFVITPPTLNRKMAATTVGLKGSEEDEQEAAKHMAHSVEVHRLLYQHPGDADRSISRSGQYFMYCTPTCEVDSLIWLCCYSMYYYYYVLHTKGVTRTISTAHKKPHKSYTKKQAIHGEWGDHKFLPNRLCHTKDLTR